MHCICRAYLLCPLSAGLITMVSGPSPGLGNGIGPKHDDPYADGDIVDVELDAILGSRGHGDTFSIEHHHLHPLPRGACRKLRVGGIRAYAGGFGLF